MLAVPVPLGQEAGNFVVSLSGMFSFDLNLSPSRHLQYSLSHHCIEEKTFKASYTLFLSFAVRDEDKLNLEQVGCMAWCGVIGYDADFRRWPIYKTPFPAFHFF